MIVHDYCIVKCKKISACGRLLMTLLAIFFAIQNIYINLNPKSHWWSLYLRMLGKGLQLKTTILLVFFLWLVKSLKKL